MNEKEQIEEMAILVTAAYNNNQQKIFRDLQGSIVRESINPPIAIATKLYEAGYRKQSDTVKEFANELNALLIEHDTGKFGLLHAKSAMRMVKELAKEYGAEVEK